MTNPTETPVRLMACPFCGSTDIKTERAHHGYKLGKLYFLVCQGCIAIGMHTFTKEFQTKKEAIAAWNHRVTPSPEARGVTETYDLLMALFTSLNPDGFTTHKEPVMEILNSLTAPAKADKEKP
jgi:Lar family restriction alleviation protein